MNSEHSTSPQKKKQVRIWRIRSESLRMSHLLEVELQPRPSRGLSLEVWRSTSQRRAVVAEHPMIIPMSAASEMSPMADADNQHVRQRESLKPSIRARLR